MVHSIVIRAKIVVGLLCWRSGIGASINWKNGLLALLMGFALVALAAATMRKAQETSMEWRSRHLKTAAHTGVCIL
jgi:hypothetical protein